MRAERLHLLRAVLCWSGPVRLAAAQTAEMIGPELDGHAMFMVLVLVLVFVFVLFNYLWAAAAAADPSRHGMIGERESRARLCEHIERL